MMLTYDNLRPPMLVFKILRMQTGCEQAHILLGSGVALIQGHRNCFGEQHESLIRERTIPLLETDTLKAMGIITFSFVIVERYEGLQTPKTDLQSLTVGKDVSLIGHRELGQNNANHRYLQLGENTIGSLLSASNLGADYVEFDVQLTRDLVPVLFHDLSLSESGTDVPVHNVTLEQFMHACKIQSPQGDTQPRLGRPRYREGLLCERRTRSLARSHEAGAQQVHDRMKHTVDYKSKGFKSNTRGHFIQDVFATLEKTLCSMPESVGFDLEISKLTPPSPGNDCLNFTCRVPSTTRIPQSRHSSHFPRNQHLRRHNPGYPIPLRWKPAHLPLFLYSRGLHLTFP
jgi:glycerophosphodiester phosphodiesterase